MARRLRLIAPVILGGSSLAAALLPLPLRSAQAQHAEGAPRDPPRVRPEARMVPQHQWEYMQLPCLPMGEPAGHRREFEERLNEQGKRGWEMVSLLEMDHPPNRGCLLATFKRQVLN